MDVALRHRLPFAIVPCCVFAREMPKRLASGEAVTTYEQLLRYLQQKAPGVQSAYLPLCVARVPNPRYRPSGRATPAYASAAPPLENGARSTE